MLYKTIVTIWSEHPLEAANLRDDVANMLDMSGTCTVHVNTQPIENPEQDDDFTDSDAQIMFEK